MLSGDRRSRLMRRDVSRAVRDFLVGLVIAYLVAVPLADHVFWVQQNYLINKMTNLLGAGTNASTGRGDSISSHTQFGESAADQ